MKRMAEMQKTATIKKCRQKDIDPKRPTSKQQWCLYTKDGSRLLGRHPSKEKARKQEVAIQIQKHARYIKYQGSVYARVANIADTD